MSRLNPRQIAIRNLDFMFSRFIRQKEMNEFGFVTCFTCPYRNHWLHLQCGHYRKRGHMATRWDETNCKPQCEECNIQKDGNELIFAENLDKLYGPGTAEQLTIESMKMVHYTVKELQQKAKHYESQIVFG